MEYHCHSSKVSWLIAPKPTGMRFELSTVAVIPRLPCLVVNERAIFTGANPLRSTQSNSLSTTSKTNTGTYACNIATQYLWMRLRPGILQLEKTLTPNELAEMPSCNLAETVHNKWLQASGNKGGDLYVAAVDDYIRAFLQVVAYYQYLKGGVGGMGPSREELRLRSAQRRAHRTGDPGVIQSALLGMPGADDFCTRDPDHEGAEVFGS